MYTHIISADSLQANLSSPDWLIVDCRFNLADTGWGRMEHKKSHIPGSVYAHLDDDLSGPIIPGKTGRHPLPSIEKLEDLFSAWGIDQKTQVVVYDQGHGGIAARLWWMLRWLGHEKVAVLNGGWAFWENQQLPVSEDVFSPTPTSFRANPAASMVATWEEVKQRFESPEIQLIDARANDRYHGENETIDPVAGHIPHAISLPFTENLGTDGLFLSPEEIKSRFEKALLTSESTGLVCYCGSGVTACHNILAMEYAGLTLPRLYPGSWSEWITDNQLPVAK